MDFRFRKSDRLLSEREFSSVLKKAHESRGRSSRILSVNPFRIYWDQADVGPQIGLSISKKILRSAVDRNRVKRCVREFFRMNKNRLRGHYLVKLQEKPKDLDYETLVGPLQNVLLGG